eukprot:15482977-Alexandrium_andersonii.AAC.1
MVGARAEAVGAGLEPRRAPRAHTSAGTNQEGHARAQTHPHTARTQARAQLVNAPPPTRTTHGPPCSGREGERPRDALALVSTAN